MRVFQLARLQLVGQQEVLTMSNEKSSTSYLAAAKMSSIRTWIFVFCFKVNVNADTHAVLQLTECALHDLQQVVR
jgi:hypothetical protein